MNGDKSKPESKFSRWVENFGDGKFSKTCKGKRRVPSSSNDKRYNRRWRRRNEKI